MGLLIDVPAAARMACRLCIRRFGLGLDPVSDGPGHRVDAGRS
jgi:hypothetical protein